MPSVKRHDAKTDRLVQCPARSVGEPTSAEVGNSTIPVFGLVRASEGAPWLEKSSMSLRLLLRPSCRPAHRSHPAKTRQEQSYDIPNRTAAFDIERGIMILGLTIFALCDDCSGEALMLARFGHRES